MDLTDLDFVFSLARAADWKELALMGVGVVSSVIVGGKASLRGVWLAGRLGSWALTKLVPEPSPLAAALISAMQADREPQLERNRISGDVLKFQKVVVLFGNPRNNTDAEVIRDNHKLAHRLSSRDLKRVLAVAEGVRQEINARESARRQQEEAFEEAWHIEQLKGG